MKIWEKQEMRVKGVDLNEISSKDLLFVLTEKRKTRLKPRRYCNKVVHERRGIGESDLPSSVREAEEGVIKKVEGKRLGRGGG